MKSVTFTIMTNIEPSHEDLNEAFKVSPSNLMTTMKRVVQEKLDDEEQDRDSRKLAENMVELLMEQQIDDNELLYFAALGFAESYNTYKYGMRLLIEAEKETPE